MVYFCFTTMAVILVFEYADLCMKIILLYAIRNALDANLDFKHGLGHQSHQCSSNIYVATFDNKTVISFVPGLRARNIQRIVNLSRAISSLSYAFSVMNLCGQEYYTHFTPISGERARARRGPTRSIFYDAQRNSLAKQTQIRIQCIHIYYRHEAYKVILLCDHALRRMLYIL